MLDLGWMGYISFDLKFLTSVVSIVIIDLVLAGDNAVVIAMAVRTLSPEKRRVGILYGAGAAVLLRVVLTAFVALLLEVSYVKLAGGLLILWIAVKLFAEGAPHDSQRSPAASIRQAIRIIVIADITMSLDNMLAVGGASHGNLFLLLFGLGLSIPFIVFTSRLLSILMDRYQAIVYVGAAILGKVGGEMVVTDPFAVGLLPAGLVTAGPTLHGGRLVLEPVPWLLHSVEAFFALAVIAAGLGWRRRAHRRSHRQPEATR